MLDVNELAVRITSTCGCAAPRSARASDCLPMRPTRSDAGSTRFAFEILRPVRIFRMRSPNVTGNHVWANDNKTLFYTRQHPETLRWYRDLQARARHQIRAEDNWSSRKRTKSSASIVRKTKSRRFILIDSEQTLSTEYRFLDADDPQGELRRSFSPREENHEYSIDHLGDEFLRSDQLEGASIFDSMKTPVARYDEG